MAEPISEIEPPEVNQRRLEEGRGAEEVQRPLSPEPNEQSEEDRAPLLPGDEDEPIDNVVSGSVCCVPFSTYDILWYGLVIVIDIVIPCLLIYFNQDSIIVIYWAISWAVFECLTIIGALISRWKSRPSWTNKASNLIYFGAIRDSSLIALFLWSLYGCVFLDTPVPALIRDRLDHLFGTVDDSVVRLVTILSTLIILIVSPIHLLMTFLFLSNSAEYFHKPRPEEQTVIDEKWKRTLSAIKGLICCSCIFSTSISTALVIVLHIVLPIILMIVNPDSIEVICWGSGLTLFASMGVGGVLLRRSNPKYSKASLLIAVYAGFVVIGFLNLFASVVNGCISPSSSFPVFVRNRLIYFFGKVDDSTVQHTILFTTILIIPTFLLNIFIITAMFRNFNRLARVEENATYLELTQMSPEEDEMISLHNSDQNSGEPQELDEDPESLLESREKKRKLKEMIERGCCWGRFSIEVATIILVIFMIPFEIVLPIVFFFNADNIGSWILGIVWAPASFLGVCGVIIGRWKLKKGNLLFMHMLTSTHEGFTTCTVVLVTIVLSIACLTPVDPYTDFLRYLLERVFGPVDDTVVRLVSIVVILLIVPFAFCLHVWRTIVFSRDLVRLHLLNGDDGNLRRLVYDHACECSTPFGAVTLCLWSSYSPSYLPDCIYNQFLW